MSGSTLSLISNVHLTRRYPVSLIHFVTHRCNARCSFCFIDFDNPETFRNELTVPEIEQITKTLGPCLQNVNLTGGEPFARKEITEIAQAYLRNTQVRSIFITSNGSLPQRIDAFLSTLTAEFPDRQLIFSFSIDAFPEEHARIRKISGLFEKTMESYAVVGKYAPQCQANVSITISPENYTIAPAIYDALIDQYGVGALTVGVVRDEGVFRAPPELRQNLLAVYTQLTGWIRRDLASGRLKGYDRSSLQGRLMNRKNELVYGIVKDCYLDPHYVAPCRAGALFGIINADGTVRPCEILDKPLGNLRDYNYDFLKLWHDSPAAEARRWIAQTKCHCTYECAWSFNILAGKQFQPALIAAALGL